MGNSKKFYRKKQRNNNKASKYRKERQRNDKKKAAASASASVSEENIKSDSYDLETVAALMVSLADAYVNPKCKDATNDLESWNPETEMHTGFDDQSTPAAIYSYDLESWNPKTEIHTGVDDETTPATRSYDSVDLKTMAALGIYVVNTHKFRKYDGPPVFNSAHDPANWAAWGNPYIH